MELGELWGQPSAQGIKSGLESKLQVRVRIRPNGGNQGQTKTQDSQAAQWWQGSSEVSDAWEDSTVDYTNLALLYGVESIHSPSYRLSWSREDSFHFSVSEWPLTQGGRLKWRSESPMLRLVIFTCYTRMDTTLCINKVCQMEVCQMQFCICLTSHYVHVMSMLLLNMP